MGAVTWATDEPLLADEDVHRAVDAAIECAGAEPLDVDVVFVDDGALAELHASFLGDPSVTDVMAFPLVSDGEGRSDEGGPDGEIYVSVDRATAVARARDVEVRRELTLYVVHGVLHLCGHDDHEPARREAMRKAEAHVMERLGFAPDEAPHDVE